MRMLSEKHTEVLEKKKRDIWSVNYTQKKLWQWLTWTTDRVPEGWERHQINNLFALGAKQTNNILLTVAKKQKQKQWKHLPGHQIMADDSDFISQYQVIL